MISVEMAPAARTELVRTAPVALSCFVICGHVCLYMWPRRQSRRHNGEWAWALVPAEAGGRRWPGWGVFQLTGRKCGQETGRICGIDEAKNLRAERDAADGQKMSAIFRVSQILRSRILRASLWFVQRSVVPPAQRAHAQAGAQGGYYSPCFLMYV